MEFVPGAFYIPILRIINYRNQFASAAVSKLTSSAVNTFSINISGLVANYKDLTADNFICDIVSYTVTNSPGAVNSSSSGSGTINQTKNISKSYDASTGDFTASIATISVAARSNGEYLWDEAYGGQGKNFYGHTTVGGSAKFNVYLIIY